MHRVIQAGGASDLPQPGDTLEIMVPAYKDEATGLAHREGPLSIALHRAQKHHPENGTVYWTGWALEDTREGRHWSPQEGQLDAAFGVLGLSTIPVVLVGAACWGYARHPHWGRSDLTAPLAGVLLAALFAGMAANSAGRMNPLFDAHFDGPPAPGPLGLVLGLALPVLAAWGSRSGQPGARTALVGGLGFLGGIAWSILWLWPPGTGAILDEFGAWAIPFLPVAVLGALTARWLPGKRARILVAGVLAVALAVFFVSILPIGLFLAIPLLGVLPACIGELLGPSVWETG